MRTSRAWVRRLVARIALILCWPFIRFEYRGGACLADSDRWIFSGNHRSVFDFPHAMVSLLHFGWDGRIMIASEFWDIPAYAWAVKAIDAIPIYRKSDPQGSLSAVITALKGGDSICIMPEGGLHWNPEEPLEMGEVKTGVSRLAVATGVPVLPLALVGGDRVWPKRSTLPRIFRRRAVVCRLADEPMWLTGDDHRANAEKVRTASEALIRRATADLQALDPSYLPHVKIHP